jgi:glutamate-ammonia-ligase adenylyltransferase
MQAVDATTRLLALARTIDSERAQSLLGDLGRGPEHAFSVLLGTAFPPLTPGATHQVEALTRFGREGLRVERRRRDLLRDARRATAKSDDFPAFLRALRRFVWAERARVALRELLPLELGGAPIEVTTRELSSLADVALELALTEARATLSARFGEPRRSDGRSSTLCAFGMGKLGGLELNAGSDVDLLFVYDSDDGDEKSELALHDYWSRVVRRAVASIDTPSDDGLIWRVDLRLRPEGSGGPLANSVAATERYYETWGRLWERAALLRARPMAGDHELGRLIAREIFTPFVYRHAVDPSIAQGIFELVQRTRRELSSDPERDLKLGQGGIREAEFFVQTLQLIWGGREPTLRVAGTLAALARLSSRGLVSDREARVLGEGYAFLRRIEHRVQWMAGVQTHLLPAAKDELSRIGRTLGHADERTFLAELRRIRGAVAELFNAITEGAERRREGSRFDALLSALPDATATATEAERAFSNAEIAEHLLALSRRPDGLLGELTRDRFPNLGRALLEELAESPDPEQASRTLRAFFARFAAPGPYVTALAEGERALARFMTVLGSSSFVGEALIARPELADVVLFGDGKVSDPRAAVALELEMQTRAPVEDGEESAQSGFVAALRLTKRRVMVEVAVADLAGTIGTRDATRLLSDLADEVLGQVVGHVCAGDTRGLSLIALGKLGGRDLGYGSDLDVIFIFDPRVAPSSSEAFTFFARRAQRIIRMLSEPSFAGPGYELDTRLRPSGSQGMLVTSLGAFARYHGVDTREAREYASAASSSGAAWERQALLRARVAAGDAELGARALAVAEQAAYEGGAPPVEELLRLRQRMQLELARERSGHYDLKVGKGGLLDIEFCVQWLQMRHGSDPLVRTSDTATALEALHAAGYLERGHFDSLRDGYGFLRRLEQRIHVLTGQSSSRIDAHSQRLLQLARRMGLRDEPGHSAAEQLLARYEAVTHSVHGAYLEALGGRAE